MSDPITTPVTTPVSTPVTTPVTTPTLAPAGPHATTAGGLLRQARQAQGLHIAALAAAIKVVPRKLELLESDQYDKLPDATFTRALAQAVCRTLKVDAAPVLALLPPPNGHRLEQVSEGLNMPFHDRPGRFVPREWASVTSPALWMAALLVVGAVLIYVFPPGWLPAMFVAGPRSAASAAASRPASAASIAAPAEPASETLMAPTEPAVSSARSAGPTAATLTVSTSVMTPAPVGALQLRATAQSWVEVVDASSQSILSRLVQPGEVLSLDGALPLKLRIGNASGVQVQFHGRLVSLTPYTRDNVARFELK